jgi:hypothetical protein
LSSLQSFKLFGAAFSVVKENVGQLGNWHTRSVVANVLRIARCAGSVSVQGLAERVNGNTKS